MIPPLRRPQCTTIRIDAAYEAAPGPRSLEIIVARIIKTVRPFLKADVRIVLIGSRGRPVVAPRDTLQRIRQNNPTLQFGLLAQALSKALDESGDVALESMLTVQVPAYRINSNLSLLENLAFDPREAANDQVLARQLAAIGDHYIIDDTRSLNDTSASIASISKSVPTRLSDSVKQELAMLDRIRLSPEHPLVVIVGGSQVSRKLRMISKLVNVADEFLVGGVVANTFLVARGVDLQRSLVDGAEADAAKQLDGILGSKLVLPTDFVWRAGRVMDIGLNTRNRFARSISEAKTVLLAGPVGVASSQLEAFRYGTAAIVEAINSRQNVRNTVVGDDTLQEWHSLGQPIELPICLSGDAASIDYLSGSKLVGLEAIQRSRFSNLENH